MHISYKVAEQLNIIVSQALRKVQSNPAMMEQVIDTVTEQIRASAPGAINGKAVLATAGPPGAGKSTFLKDKYPDYRMIDPDENKKLILQEYNNNGFFNQFFAIKLADGRNVQPLELAGAVHNLSSIISDTIAEDARLIGENIILDGTFKSINKGKDILTTYMQAGYEQLDIADVEVNLGQAARNAHQRWWEARKSGENPLGGRFVPPEIIWSLAGHGTYTRSLANAIATLQLPLPQESSHFTRTLTIQDKIIYDQPRIYQWERSGDAEIIATAQTNIPADLKQVTQDRLRILDVHNQSLPKKNRRAYAWCAVCNRPIWSPASILTGMGASCRKNAGL